MKGNKERSQSRETESLQMERLWRPVFDRYDHDGDGFIQLDEFKTMIKERNENLEEEIPAEVLEEILERADWDKDRQLSFHEFLRMIHARDVAAHRPQLARLIYYAARAVVPKDERQAVINQYLDHYTCCPPPLFMIGITILEIAVFAYYCVDKSGTLSGQVPIDSVLIYNPKRRYEIWRYLTYMLLHAGFVHIFFNILVQLLLGVPLELVHKGWRIGLVYMAGVIGGSLGASISDPYAFLVGASGGVYGIIAAHLSNVIINWSEMEFGPLRLLCLLVFGGTDIGVAVYERYNGNGLNKTSYAAHVTGAISGLLVGIVVLRNLRVRRWEKVVSIVSVVFFLGLLLFAILWNVVYPSYFPKPVYS